MANFRYLNDSTDKFKQLNKMIKSGFDVTSGVAEDLDLGDDSVKEMRDIMLKYAAMERDLKNYVKATDESRRVFESDDTNDFQAVFEQQYTSLEVRNRPDDLVKHTAVKAFDETIMKQHFGGDDGDDDGSPSQMGEDDDLELQMTQHEDSRKFICPITKVELVDPVTNECGHTYSRRAIETHIRNNKNRSNTPCPVAGCVSKVQLESLEDNKVLAYRIRQKNKN